MNGYLIALIVVACLIGFYLFLFFVDLVFIGTFSKKLKEHNRALTILLTQKYESLDILLSIYKKNGIKVDSSFLDAYRKIDIIHFENMDTKECIKDRTSLSLLRQELVGMVKNDVDFQKNEEFQICIKMMSTIDEQFRTISASYNADVIGYNYWIRFRPFKYLFIFNHVELKEIIS